jgi:hypothetical protein
MLVENITLVPLCGSQKLKRIQRKLFKDWEWLVDLRRSVLEMKIFCPEL